jgi:general secretion pathway protein A
LRQLKQRVALRCELRPLTSAETLAYLAGRVRAAGGVASRIFTREAAALLHEHSGGIPRVINVLADNALLAAFAKQTPQVTSRLVNDVARDFHIGHPTAATNPAAPVSAAPPATPAIELVAEPSLLAVSPAATTNDPVTNEPTEVATETAAMGTIPARRRFGFLGRRGTA